MARLCTLVAAMLILAGCTRQYVPGNAEPIEIKLGAESVTYCADDGITEGTDLYFDHGSVPDPRVSSLQRVMDENPDWELVERPSTDYLSRRKIDIACRRKPFRPYKVYYSVGATDGPSLKSVVNGQAYSVFWADHTYFTRDGRIVLIDVRAICPGGDNTICFSTPAEFHAEMDRLGREVRQPQQAVE